MRRVTACLLTLLLLLGFTVTAHATAGVRVMINGAIASIDPTITEHGRILVPADSAAELFGFTLSINRSEEMITLARENSTTIVMWIDKGKAYINSKDVAVDTPPREVNGDVYVPLRFVAEADNYVVRWDSKEKMVTLTPARSFLDELAEAKQPDDQRLTGNLQMSYAMTPAPGLKITMDAKLSLDAQLYKGESLTKTVFDLDGDSITAETAVVDGKAYSRSSPDKEWSAGVPATVDSTDSMATLLGDLNLSQAGPDLLKGSGVHVVGSAEKDGARVIKLMVELSPAKVNGLANDVFGAVGGPEQLGDTAVNPSALVMKANHFTVTYWVNPDNLFTHRVELDVDVNLFVTDSKDPMKVNLTLKGGFDATKLTEPIQFPTDLPKD